MHESLWQSWSQKGRAVASVILKIPIEGVLPTTNHLESFNCLLKRKYIPRWQRSGSRLRFDFLIHVLITQILPDIFASRLANQNYHIWLASRFADHAGGVNLVESKKANSNAAAAAALIKPCWWEPDNRRDGEAWAILQSGRLHSIQQTISPEQYEATCLSASAYLNDPSATQYQLYLHRTGHGHCSCADFLFRGGACKHIRALRVVLDSWVQKQCIAPFHYPSSEATARLLHPTPLPTLASPGSVITPLPDSIIHTSAPSVVANAVALQQIIKNGSEMSGWREDDETEGDIDSISSDTSSNSSRSVDVNEVNDPSSLVCSSPIFYFSVASKLMIVVYCTPRRCCYNTGPTASRTYNQGASTSSTWLTSPCNRKFVAKKYTRDHRISGDATNAYLQPRQGLPSGSTISSPRSTVCKPDQPGSQPLTKHATAFDCS